MRFCTFVTDKFVIYPDIFELSCINSKFQLTNTSVGITETLSNRINVLVYLCIGSHTDIVKYITQNRCLI